VILQINAAVVLDVTLATVTIYSLLRRHVDSASPPVQTMIITVPARIVVLYVRQKVGAPDIAFRIVERPWPNK